MGVAGIRTSCVEFGQHTEEGIPNRSYSWPLSDRLTVAARGVETPDRMS